MYQAKSIAEQAILMAQHKVNLLWKKKMDLKVAQQNVEVNTAAGISLQDQLKYVQQYEERKQIR